MGMKHSALLIPMLALMPTCSPARVPTATSPTAGPAPTNTGATPSRKASPAFDCQLEMPALDELCQPGAEDLRGAFGSACPARCDASGHWQVAKVCIAVVAGSNGTVYFHHNSHDPDPRSVEYLRAALGRSSGRYYVLGWVDSTESVDGLALSRARAVIDALVATGVCTAKFTRALDAGVDKDAPVPRTDPQPRVQVLLADPGTEQHLRERGILPPLTTRDD